MVCVSYVKSNASLRLWKHPLSAHYESLARAIRFGRTSDAKAAPVLALHVALVGTLAARSDKLLAIIGPQPWSTEGYILIALIVLYAPLLLWIFALAGRVYVPINPKTGKSLIYFEDIASLDRKLFKCRAKGMSEEAIETDLVDQIHRISQIASDKMRYVRLAIHLSAPAVMLWLALFVWSAVGEA